MDEDEDYQWIKDEGMTSTLDPLQLGLVLVGQPIGVVEDLTTVVDLGIEQPNTAMDIDPILDVVVLEILATSGPPAELVPTNPPAIKDNIEIGGEKNSG